MGNLNDEATCIAIDDESWQAVPFCVDEAKGICMSWVEERLAQSDGSANASAERLEGRLRAKGEHMSHDRMACADHRMADEFLFMRENRGNRAWFIRRKRCDRTGKNPVVTLEQGSLFPLF